MLIGGLFRPDMTDNYTYIPGSFPAKQEPLARFLPPVPVGVVSSWLKSTLPPGALILDPFCSVPQLPVEAARSGYRVIVTANNPIAQFVLRSIANPPSEAELQALLADVAASFRGQDRLEPHLRSLYATRCDNCEQMIEAGAYVWDREADLPFARQYSCPHCAESAIQSITEDDQNLAAQFALDKLNRARALERVVSLDDPDRHHVEEALAMYQPRALYAIFTLINRLDRMDLSPSRRRNLEMLLLSTFDRTNSLWAYPGGRTRPKQLTLSPKFYENNVWKAMEDGIQEWVSGEQEAQPELSVTEWPDLPPSQGGISIFTGRLKEFSEALEGIDINGAICAVPRPNQAYWTFSALWSGWLWGRDSVRHIKSVLRRRRYDWNWHSIALHSFYDNLVQILSAGVPVFGLVGEAEPGLLTSTITASEMAGLVLEGYALRPENDQVQLTWRTPAKIAALKPAKEQSWRDIIGRTAVDYLEQRAEPAGYLQIHAAMLYELTKNTSLSHGIPADAEQSPSDLYNKLTHMIEQTLTYHTGLVRLSGSEKSIETGQWWIKTGEFEGITPRIPLADRVENKLVEYLLEHPGDGLLGIDRYICTIFPGILTPGGDLVHTSTESYAVRSPRESDQWIIRPEDIPETRGAHIRSIHEILVEIADRLGFSTRGNLPLIWTDENEDSSYIFYIIGSAAFGELLNNCPYPASRSIIVIPGSRANLARLKLKNNYHLNHIFSQGWRFLKFRHVYRLLESPMLDRDNFDALLELDPLQDTTQQMRLL